MQKISIVFFFILFSQLAHSSKCNSEIFERKNYSNSENFSDISANSSQISNKNLFQLSGDVNISGFDYALSADKFTINKKDSSGYGEGNIEYQDNDLQISSSSMSFDRSSELNSYEFISPVFHLINNGLNGKSDTLTGNKNIKSLKNASISGCSMNNPQWLLTASDLTINSINNTGVARDAKLSVLGVPIFYSPSIEWPLKGKGTGFLFPSFSNYTNSNGNTAFQSIIPYFFNLSPDKDLLLSINHLSDRGISYNSLFRALIPQSNNIKNGRLEFAFNHLNVDKLSQSDRWLIDSKLAIEFLNRSNLNLNYRRVSDKDYLKDILLENEEEERIISFVDFNTEVLSSNLKLFSESEQLVNSGTSQYMKSSEISLNKKIYTKKLINPINFNFSSTNYDHLNPQKITGNRNSIEASYDWILTKNNIVSNIDFSLTGINYDLDNGSNFKKLTYDIKLNSETNLEREFNIGGKNYIQTLRPRVAYIYSPIKAQNSYPNFDSGLITRSYESLFNGKKYSGLDRHTNKNLFALGIESEIINKKSGKELGSLYMGQKFNFTDTETDLSGNQVALRKYSNIYAGLTYKLKNILITHDLELNPKTNNIDSSKSSIEFSNGQNNFFNISLINDDEETVNISTVFSPISNYEILYSINRSISNSINNKELLSIGYNSCCLGTRIVYEKDYLGNNDFEKKIGFEFVLKGLGSSSQGMNRRLIKSVPNYVPSSL